MAIKIFVDQGHNPGNIGSLTHIKFHKFTMAL